MTRFLIAAALVATGLVTPGAAQRPSYSPSVRYPTPDGDMNAVRRRGPCTDPWVTIALEINNGWADPAECAPALYAKGAWKDFNELVHAVAATKATIGPKTLEVLPVKGAPVSMIGVFDSAGNLVAAGGGNLVAAGGGNLVAAGGGNAVAIIGNQLVAAGGGNLAAPVATLTTNTYGVQSGRSIRLPAGVIKF